LDDARQRKPVAGGLLIAISTEKLKRYWFRVHW